MSKKKNKQNRVVPAEPEIVPEQSVLPAEPIVEKVQTEMVQIPFKEKKRIPLTHRTWAKIIVFMLTILFAATAVLAVIAAVAMIELGVYAKEEEQYRTEVFNTLSENIAYDVLNYVVNDCESDVEPYLRHKNVAGISIIAGGSRVFTWQYGDTAKNSTATICKSKWLWYQNNTIRGATLDSNRFMDTVYVSVYIPEDLTTWDDFRLADAALEVGYAMCYWIYAIAAAGLLLSILCFVFLMCASGRREGLDEPQPGWGTRVPFDVLTAAFFVAIFLIAQVADDASYFASIVKQVVVWSVCGVLGAALSLGWCMSAAVRFKLGKWWKNTVVFRVLHLAFRVLIVVMGATKKILLRSGAVIARVVEALPLLWKTAAVFAAVTFVEFVAVMAFRRDTDMLIITWMLLHLGILAGVLYIALILRRLQKGGEALAAGDLSYQVDTKGMLSDFKAHAESLSRIGEGMTAAVEQRLKSERMKTELITNVSHDIKTPLTSIINYSDLIGREPCENGKITEYAAVLHRQSERLKRLIDDLVEASKASTGNLDVHLAPCEVGVMLSQTVGEYEQRLEQGGLTTVTKQPDQPVRIMADGRRLWRVFDNLMNNICKYAMSGTRVYLTLEAVGGEAVISFKNTSREPLDLSADELMERFVRGDAARGGEGNGLGLSIARSLTQLQNGTLELTVDGDLFKAVLRFPMI